jgi:hypothetical protein
MTGTNEGSESCRRSEKLAAAARYRLGAHRRAEPGTALASCDSMELRVSGAKGIRTLTFCMPCSMVSSDDVALGPVAAGQTGFDVWARLAGSGGIWGHWHLVWHW